jgi:hypothetical protein
MAHERLINAVLRVGDGGRGFRVGDYVITVAHCLPHLPPAHMASYLEERTYQRLLGKLTDKEPSVSAEVLFVDPVSDLAILGSPDNQELSDEADAYQELLSQIPSFTIGDIEASDVTTKEIERNSAKILSLGRREWITCKVCHIGGHLLVDEPATERGMSGSPIIDDNGRAIGVVASGSGSHWSANPRLMRSLPRWFDIDPGAEQDCIGLESLKERLAE